LSSFCTCTTFLQEWAGAFVHSLSPVASRLPSPRYFSLSSSSYFVSGLPTHTHPPFQINEANERNRMDTVRTLHPHKFSSFSVSLCLMLLEVGRKRTPPCRAAGLGTHGLTGAGGGVVRRRRREHHTTLAHPLIGGSDGPPPCVLQERDRQRARCAFPPRFGVVILDLERIHGRDACVSYGKPVYASGM
jgi:hypothetical protein